MKEEISYEELMFSSFYNTQLNLFITQKLIEGTSTIDLQEFFSLQSIQRAYPIQAAEISELLFL